MYHPDDTHAALMHAEHDLGNSRNAIEAGMWAAKVLALLLTSAEVGAMDKALAFLKDNANKIAAIPGACTEGTKAIDTAISALLLARREIPDTSPNRGGLEQLPSGGRQESFNESCSAPSAPTDDWTFIAPT